MAVTDTTKQVAGDEGGMGYLQSLPRRVVTIYLPLLVFVFVLLFPFYWMAITVGEAERADDQLQRLQPVLGDRPDARAFPLSAVRDVLSGLAVEHDPHLDRLDRRCRCFAAVFAAYAIERLRFSGSRQVGLAIFLAYLVPPSILFIPLSVMVFKLGLYDTPFALILTYPTFLVPFCTWLLMGYFRSIPYELEECALIDGASRWQILTKIILPLSVPGLISAGIFAFTLSWNEFIYALTFIQSSENKTVPVGVLTELVRSDVYEWGALMAGALIGSLPVVILYSFFVEHYVSSMTGAVKE